MKQFLRLFTACTVGVLMLFVLTSCGGDDEPKNGPTPASSTDETASDTQQSRTPADSQSAAGSESGETQTIADSSAASGGTVSAANGLSAVETKTGNNASSVGKAEQTPSADAGSSAVQNTPSAQDRTSGGGDSSADASSGQKIRVDERPNTEEGWGGTVIGGLN